jgi:guanylate kinase
MTLVDRELAAAKIFDYAIVNDDLETAVDQVLEVIEAVRVGRGEAISSMYGRDAVMARWNESQVS